MLETRNVLTTTLFVDFGLGIGLGETLSVSRDDLKEIFGPGNNASGTGPYTSAYPASLEFSPLEYDFNGDDLLTADDIEQLSQEVVSVVERILAPFDIDIQIASASDLEDAVGAVGANEEDVDGEFDAYVFAVDVLNHTGAQSLSAPDDRTALLGNLQDEAALVLSGHIFDQLANVQTIGTEEFNRYLVNIIADVVSHEALHTFGLWHSIWHGEVMHGDLLISSDVPLVSRFVIATEGTGAVNQYDILTADDDIGFRDDNRNDVPDFAYVSGTGYFDQITLEDAGGGIIDVTVRSYFSEGFSNLLGELEYSIDLSADTEAATVVIEAGLKDDLIQIDSSISAVLRVRGGAGDDRVEIVDSGPFAFNALEVMGENGNDSLVIDYGAFATAALDSIRFVGGDEIDELVIDGIASGAISTRQKDSDVTVGFGGDEVVYELDGVERLEVDDNSGAVLVTSTYVLNSLSDVPDLAETEAGNRLVRAGAEGQISLRAAIDAANRTTGKAVIEFDPTLDGSIVLENGQLELDSDVDILGERADVISIDADGDSRVIDVASGADVLLAGLTITGGEADMGGGIYSAGNLTLHGVHVYDNNAMLGGGIYQTGGSLLVVDSSATENTAFVAAAMHASNSDVDIVNSTISTNTASYALGGVYLYRDVAGPLAYLASVTIADNQAGMGSSAGLSGGTATYPIQLVNSIVAGNTSTSSTRDVDGSFHSGSHHNYIGYDPTTGNNLDNGAQNNQVGTALAMDPLLSALGDFGGALPTHTLLSGSDAIDAGDNTAGSFGYDQRGFPHERIVDGDGNSNKVIDLGATEVQTPRVVSVIISGSASFHAPYDFAEAEYEGQAVVGSGNQLRTVPVGGANSVTIRFNQDVDVDENDLSIIGLVRGTVPTLAASGFSYDDETFEATWQFSNPFVAEQYLIKVRDEVFDAIGHGLSLDGEWDNPLSLSDGEGTSSEFPSGDGIEGGAFEFVFVSLAGDANQDNQVGPQDLVKLGLGWSNANQLFEFGEFDGTGTVGPQDLVLLNGNWDKDFRNLLLASLDSDLDIDASDLAILSSNLGMSSPERSDGDIDGDLDVDANDLAILELMVNFGVDLG